MENNKGLPYEPSTAEIKVANKVMQSNKEILALARHHLITKREDGLSIIIEEHNKLFNHFRLSFIVMSSEFRSVIHLGIHNDHLNFVNDLMVHSKDLYCLFQLRDLTTEYIANIVLLDPRHKSELPIPSEFMSHPNLGEVRYIIDDVSDIRSDFYHISPIKTLYTSATMPTEEMIERIWRHFMEVLRSDYYDPAYKYINLNGCADLLTSMVATERVMSVITVDNMYMSDQDNLNTFNKLHIESCEGLIDFGRKADKKFRNQVKRYDDFIGAPAQH